MVTLSKINYQNATRIEVSMIYDQVLTQKIMTIEGRQWSKTLKNLVIPPKKRLSEDTNISNELDKIEVSWHGKMFNVRMPYNKTHVSFLRKLRGSWWNGKYKIWILQGNIENLERLQKQFLCFDEVKYSKLYELIGLQSDPMLIELYKTPEHLKKIMMKVKGFRADVAFVKSIPDRVYNKVFKRWEIPYHSEVVKRILSHYKDRGYKIINRLPKNSKTYEKLLPDTSQRIVHLLSKHDLQYHSSIIVMTEALVRMKYSWKTVTLYTGKLVQLMAFVKKFNMDKITTDDVNSFLSSLAKDDVSESMLNQVYSAVKFYFEKAKHIKDFEMTKLKRPRKGTYLPSILSIQEVDRILGALDNLKHISILYTMYGGGLRLGEVLNLRVEDIFWDRNQIFIKAGKGKKDRLVMLSQLLKELLKKYFDEYQPEYWLYEGQNRTHKYSSSSSVSKIVKRATTKAGISRRVTPHTFRHCFGTHLMDSGLDTRYIQKLLGHKDIKTTMIYTHVTNRSLAQIISPLDSLMRKKNQE